MNEWKRKKSTLIEREMKDYNERKIKWMKRRNKEKKRKIIKEDISEWKKVV